MVIQQANNPHCIRNAVSAEFIPAPLASMMEPVIEPVKDSKHVLKGPRYSLTGGNLVVKSYFHKNIPYKFYTSVVKLRNTRILPLS